jgi:hypothetical protein
MVSKIAILLEYWRIYVLTFSFFSFLDFSWNLLAPKEADKMKRMVDSELLNGRLAMMAIGMSCYVYTRGGREILICKDAIVSHFVSFFPLNRRHCHAKHLDWAWLPIRINLFQVYRRIAVLCYELQ